MGKLPVAGCMWIPRLRPPVLRLDGGGAGLLVPRDHLATPAVDPARLAVVAGEPDGIAGFQVQRLRREGLHLARAPLPQTPIHLAPVLGFERDRDLGRVNALHPVRSEENTSELQSLMRISYAFFCLKKKKKNNNMHN